MWQSNVPGAAGGPAEKERQGKAAAAAEAGTANKAGAKAGTEAEAGAGAGAKSPGGDITPQRVWNEFIRAKHFNDAIGLYETVEKNEHFYIGDQWRGVNAPDLDQPVMNMLSRVVKYFVASVMSDDIGVSVTDFDDDEALKPLLEMLGSQFDAVMEGCGFRHKAREAIRNAAVDGDGCIHFYFDAEDDAPQPGDGSIGFASTPGHIEAEIIENTNVHFGDPQSGDLQRQPYLLLHFRRLVEDVRRTARENGGDADAVQPDEDENRYSDAPEEGKVTVVRRYWKQRGANGRKTVWFCEVSDGAMVRRPTDTGYTRYPIAFMPWEKVKDQFHGQAAITGMIPNQIFVNKLFAMAMQHVKHMAFPKIVYNRNLLAGRKWSNRVGEAIGVNGDPNLAVATGLRAPDMSSQVLVMIDKVIAYTRDTMGASDAALGNVAPDNTSAIIAVQKATSMPLELQRQDFYTFVEDSVRVWLDMMAQNYGVRPVRLKVRGKAPGMGEQTVPFGKNFLPKDAQKVFELGENTPNKTLNVLNGAEKLPADLQGMGQGMAAADALGTVLPGMETGLFGAGLPGADAAGTGLPEAPGMGFTGKGLPEAPGMGLTGIGAEAPGMGLTCMGAEAFNMGSAGMEASDFDPNIAGGNAKAPGPEMTGMLADAAGAQPVTETEEHYETVPFDFSRLQNMELRLNVDVGAATYWSELMQVQTLDNLFARGVLTDAVTYLENMPRGYIPGRQAIIEAIRKRQQTMPQAPQQGLGAALLGKGGS